MSDLYFNEESDYSEENRSGAEGFHSTILPPFQFELEQKKRVIMRAMRKKLQKQSFRYSSKYMFLKISQILQKNDQF